MKSSNMMWAKCTLVAGLLLNSAYAGGAATLDSVTYQVNMSVQRALGNFNPANGDTVYVSGNWDSWSTTNLMSASSDTNIYTLTLNQSNGTWPNYKFFINPGGTSSGSSLVWETISANRWFALTTSTTNLPVVYFNNVTNVPSYQVQITFQLSMEYAIQQGKFTIGSDYVDAFGSFNSWSTTGTLLTNVTGTSNYIGTFTATNLLTNTVVYYKYAIDDSTWEGYVGTNGAENRNFTLTATNQTLPLDYWDNNTNSVGYDVTFQVDMTVETALGNFTPGSDEISVSGGWNNWSGSANILTQSGADTNIFTGTVSITNTPGTTIAYKYVMNEGINASDWENIDNREFSLAATNLQSYFDNYSNLGPLNISFSGADTILAWDSGTNSANRIRLQSATSLLAGWTDVSNSQGQSAVTNNFGGSNVFFRLIGP